MDTKLLQCNVANLRMFVNCSMQLYTMCKQTKKTCSRCICSLVPTSLTNCFQSTSSEHCMAPL